jgi:hypothetical protein
VGAREAMESSPRMPPVATKDIDALACRAIECSRCVHGRPSLLSQYGFREVFGPSSALASASWILLVRTASRELDIAPSVIRNWKSRLLPRTGRRPEDALLTISWFRAYHNLNSR